MDIQLDTLPFDPAEHLGSDDAIAAYLDEAFAIGEPGFIGEALGVVARARGLTEVARAVGISREELSEGLAADGGPDTSMTLRIIKALGLRLTVAPNRAAAE